MSAIKLSISLDEKQLGWLKRQAKRQRTSISALLAEALADWRRACEREQLIRRLGGRLELDEREVADIHREWNGG